MSKKQILILATILVVISIVILNFYFFRVIPRGLSSSLKAVATEEGFVTESEALNCDKETCDTFYLERIIWGIETNLDSIDSPSKLKEEMKDLEESYKQKSPSTARKSLNTLIRKYKEIIAEYEKTHEVSINSIKETILEDGALGLLEKEDLRVNNIRIMSGYIVAAIYPTEGATDPVSVILKKEDGKYTLVGGPGTLFEYDKTIPQEVIDEANLITAGPNNEEEPAKEDDFIPRPEGLEYKE